MSKILLAGAGGAPTENVIRSLKKCNRNEEIIGMGSEPSDLVLSHAEKKYLVPYAVDKTYASSLIRLLNKEKPDLLHFQNDIEILAASNMRDEILHTGTNLFMPEHTTIEKCVDKSKSAAIWAECGVKIPKTTDIKNKADLKKAFDKLGDEMAIFG